MTKLYLTVVLTLTCLLAQGVSAHAQDVNRVVVNIPFEFVAGGKTLPAGTYSVSRVSPQTSPSLIVRGDHDSALVLPVVSDGIPAEHVGLIFERVGDKHLLNKVETPGGSYTILTPRAMTRLARVNEGGTLSPSGAN
jgi:hypothetical protein